MFCFLQVWKVFLPPRYRFQHINVRKLFVRAREKDGDTSAAVLRPLEQLPVEFTKCFSETPHVRAFCRRYACLRKRDAQMSQGCSVGLFHVFREVTARKSLSTSDYLHERYEVSFEQRKIIFWPFFDFNLYADSTKCNLWWISCTKAK